jgi:molecular chaperone DnaK
VNPSSTFHSVKRFIGREFDDVAEDAARVAYTVGADEDGDVVMKCPNTEEGEQGT